MHYWFDRGIDGFRMDVIPFISKDTTFPEITENDLLKRFGSVDWPRYYAEGPKLHPYLREMNLLVLSHYDAMVLGDGAGVNIENALKFVDEERKELDLFFHFDSIEDYRDFETLNKYRQLRNEGKDPQEYMEGWKLMARDNGRTPFQWDESPNAGFSTGSPWIKVNSNYTTLNAASQEDDPDSILIYFRRMIELRKACGCVRIKRSFSPCTE